MGSFSVLNNISGINAQNQLNLNNVNLSRTLARLSSGKRIASGADDAAGLQIADSLNANVYALNQSIRNANDGIGVGQIADGALQQITNLLTRGVTLAEEAATETVDANGKTSLQAEFTSIQAEIARIATQTNFNGAYLFTPTGLGGDGKLSVFVGDMSSSSTIDLSIDAIKADAKAGTVTALGTTDLTKVDLTTDAAGALTSIQAALNTVAAMRGKIGAGMNQLQSAVSVLQTQVENTQSAESTIRDANMAQEISNLTKEQILAQSGMAALAQANSSSQSVLTLLKNA